MAGCPEIKIIVEQLSKFLIGKELESIRINSSSKYYLTDLINENIKNDLNIQYKYYETKELYSNIGKIVDIYSKGKIIIIVVKNKDMEIFFISKQGGKFSFDSEKPDKIFKIITKNDEEDIIEYLYFNDNKFLYDQSLFKCIISKEELNNIINSIGIDYFSKEINKNIFKSMIKTSRKINIELVSFLFNQKWFSGLIEYLISDIMYLSLLHPKTKLGELTDKECSRLYKTIINVLNNSYNLGGYNYMMPDGSIGKYNCLVYGLEEDINGNKITKEKYKTKYIYYCNDIQK